MVTLNRSAYEEVNAEDRDGIRCNFTVKNRPKGAFTIVQNIDVHIHTVDAKGNTDDYKRTYSELWFCPAKTRSFDFVDNFLVPKNWRQGYDGFYKVTAVAYFVKIRPTGYKLHKIPRRKKRKKNEPEHIITHIDSKGQTRPGLPPWGTLAGRWDTFVPEKKKVLAGLTRVIKMEWNNITDSSADLSVGADLQVTIDSTRIH